MVAGLLDSQQRGLLNRQAGGLLAGSPSFATMYPGVGMNTPPLRSMTPEMAAALVQQGMPSLAPSQFVQGMAGGAADLAMQANQAMPWGGNDPSAIGIDTQAGTIDPSVMVPFASNVAGYATTGALAAPPVAGGVGMGIRAKPRTFYRGTNPGDTRRISTGDAQWDGHLFASSDPEQAKMYGSNIQTIEAKPDAKILYEGSAEFIKVAGKWRKGENLLQYSSRAAQAAREAGYDAVWFKMQGNVGTAIINPDKFDSLD